MISAVGLFCYDKFKETPNKKVINLSKLTKCYFKYGTNLIKHAQRSPGVLNIFNGVLIYLTFVQDKSIGFYNFHKGNLSVWNSLKTYNIKNNYSIGEDGIWVLGLWFSNDYEKFWKSNFMAFELYS